MARPRKTSAVLESLKECDRVMERLLLATLDLEKEEAIRDGAIATAVRTHKPRITVLSAKITDLELQLQNYYMTHTAELEADGKKSVQLKFGVMGRRKGKPSLVPLKKSWTWKAILIALRDRFGEQFLSHPEPKVDKDKVKAEIPPESLAEFGLRIKQEEAFFTELFRPERDEAN